MSKASRTIPERVVKTLFALSGNRCAFPGCGQALVESGVDDTSQSVVGVIAHIVAHSDDGPRANADYPVDKVNSHENLVLLCPTCHTRIDKNEHQYTTHVLREMKRTHESKYASAGADVSMEQEATTDEVFASALPVSRLPFFVYSAETDFRKQNAADIWDHIEQPPGPRLNLPFDLRNRRLYAFHNLANIDGPFREVCRPATSTKHSAAEMWKNADEQRAYTFLMNRALKNCLHSKGVRFHPRHQRFYFLPGKHETRRTETYKSLSGRAQKRNVVWNPMTKATGRGKRHWIHLAAGLSLQYIGCEKWILTIRPERYLTKDGRLEFESRNVGRKVTRLKATLHNRAYLGEVRFWASFLSDHGPRLSLRFGNQWLTIENRLLECTVDWVEIPGDDQAFTERQPEEDLFSFAELCCIDDQLDGLDEYDQEI